MEEVNGNRVVVTDIVTGQTRTKSTAEIVRENEALSKRLSNLKQNDLLKEAIRNNNFRTITKPQESQDKQIAEEIKQQIEKSEDIKEVEMTSGAVGKRHVSLKFGVIGSGQAGGRIAEVFSQYGYDVCAVNTAKQDLEFLNIGEDRKYLVDTNELGGTGKDIDISAQCFEEREEEIREFINEKVGDSEAFVLAISGGGGTGSGSAELLASWLGELGKPVVVIYILPGSFDDSQAKYNAITTLDKLADLASREAINSLILVDNANIELAFPDLSQAAFFKTANRAVVEPLHMFNSVSVMPTNYEALDSMDFAKSLIEAGNCVVFGTNTVSREQYENDETALMESIISGLGKGLLASGFDLKEAQTVGILVTAPQAVLEEVPYSSIAYMFKYINDEFASAKSFKGVYAVPSDSDDITIRFIFSGMGLPKGRVESLKEEVKKHTEILDSKKKLTNMKVGLTKDKAGAEIDRNIAKIKKKKSGIGKLLGGGSASKIERRR